MQQVKEFTTNGMPLRDIKLPSELVNPHHSVLLTSGQLLVCHGFESDAVNRLCLVDVVNGSVMQSMCSVSSTGPPAAADKLLQPMRIVVDETRAIGFIADFKNDRIVVVDLVSLSSISVVKDVGLRPCSMFIDHDRGKLYVGSWETGHIAVFQIDP